MAQPNDVLLFSGGMDSYIAWYFLIKPNSVYCDLGHRYAKIERQKIALCEKSVGMNCKIETRLNLADWEELDANIPMRNLFLAALAAKDPDVDVIWLICQEGETSIPDRSPDFMAKAGELLSILNSRPVRVQSPFLNQTKVDMVGWYIKTQSLVDPGCLNLMANTIGCYQPIQYSNSVKHCGRCAACFRRWVAFKYNKVENDFEYENDLRVWSGTEHYYKRMLEMVKTKDFGQYGQRRVEQTMEVLSAIY